MDFSRNTQAQPAAAGHTAPSGVVNSVKRNSSDSDKVTRIVTSVVAVLVAILLVFVALTVYSSSKNSEEGYVDNSRLQAVFLNTGQVYFGKISTLNSKYFVVKDIYYLQTSSAGTTTAASNTSVSLVKLGCELHQPFDQMVINASQVTFWENLKSDGQVAKAVSTFQKQNPDGQKCSNQTANNSTTNNVQNAGTANTGAPATTTPATTNKP